MFLLLVVMLDRPLSEVEWRSTFYPLHSPVSPSHPLPCVFVCHHISAGLYSHLTITLLPVYQLISNEAQYGYFYVRRNVCLYFGISMLYC